MSSNIDALIRQLNKGVDAISVKPTTRFDFGLPSFAVPSLPSLGSIGPLLRYIMLIALVVLVVLILVHFLVTPVFKTKMGGPGIVSLPTSQNSLVLWKKEPTPTPVTGTLIEGISYNYTIGLDVFIDNPNEVTDKYKLVFMRGTGAAANTTGAPHPATIADQLGDQFSLAAYLDKGKNDLLITVLTTQKDIKTVVIKNVPVHEAFRVVMVVTDTYMDVYYNNRLAGSVTYSDAPSTNAIVLSGPSTPSILVKNLIIFDRPLTPAEAKEISPGLADFPVASAAPISPTGTCSTQPSFFAPPQTTNQGSAPASS